MTQTPDAAALLELERQRLLLGGKAINPPPPLWTRRMSRRRPNISLRAPRRTRKAGRVCPRRHGPSDAQASR